MTLAEAANTLRFDVVAFHDRLRETRTITLEDLRAIRALVFEIDRLGDLVDDIGMKGKGAA